MSDFSKICLSYAATLYFVGAKGGILTIRTCEKFPIKDKTFVITI